MLQEFGRKGGYWVVESGGYNLRVLTGDTSYAADPWMPRSAKVLGCNRK